MDTSFASRCRRARSRRAARVVGASASVMAILALCGACMGIANRGAVGPIPDVILPAEPLRGSLAAQGEVRSSDNVVIAATIVRDFFRPFGGQARWIDPRPLSHVRSDSADVAEDEDPDWSEAVVAAAGLERVCIAERTNDRCASRPGGVIRFSNAFAAGRDSARIFARYTTRGDLTAGAEMGFLVARRDGRWTIASKSTLPGSRAPATAIEELVATDRRFGRDARHQDGILALATTFDDSIILPVGQRFVEGREAAVAALRENSQNAASRLEWAPIRAGVSADGQHGFTFGFMTQRVGDSTHAVKYLAYWVKRPAGWRVLTLRRRRAASGPRNSGMMAPSLPPVAVTPTSDASVIQRHRASLAAAEQAFSDSAHVVGLQGAFEGFGHPDAVNLGGPNTSDFVVGSPAIGRAVGAGSAGQPSPVSWKADHGVVVASSGDLGVTFGYIRPNATDSRQPAGGSPFFTIWRRASASAPWRYIAE
jgi:hypothetical protein